jgi:hypothetical protein
LSTGVNRAKTWWALVLVLLLPSAVPLAAQPSLARWPDEWLAEPLFFEGWARTDGPVASRSAARSWVWGPQPFAVANESYAESPTGRRLVAYLDKGRMEVNDPAADRLSPWFVSSGLLVSDMVVGHLQVGNATFSPFRPADVPVAGDAGSSNAPLYSSFAPHTSRVPRSIGSRITQRINRDGTLVQVQPNLPLAVLDSTKNSQYDDVTGHNVPAIFADWSRQQGLVLVTGRLVAGQVIDPLYVLGRPITEAYWAEVNIRGVPTVILVQLYERRALTFNPQNPPGWQVEMANVGRAYYDWRYAEGPPAPAVAAELAPDGALVRGWNWPEAISVTVQISLAGRAELLSGPQTALPGSEGRFKVKLPLTPDLAGALTGKASLRVAASAGEFSASLPMGGSPPSAPVKADGQITQVAFGQGSEVKLELREQGGKVWSLTAGSESKLLFSEGSPATRDALQTGAWVSFEGTGGGGKAAVSTLTLHSVSKSGATFGFSRSRDGKTLRISGRGWPSGGEVAFSLRLLNGQGAKAFATTRADSRGNLNFSAPMPAQPQPGDTTWMVATALSRGAVVAQFVVPYLLRSSDPPDLTLLSRSGEQMGGPGSYCWETLCADTIGLPIPLSPLIVSRGVVLGLRSQYGPDPNLGLLPSAFTVNIHPYPADPNSQGTTIEGVYYFRPGDRAVHSVRVPGRPFSVAMPPNLTPGTYIVTIFAGWQPPSGGAGDSSYGFLVLIP